MYRLQLRCTIRHHRFRLSTIQEYGMLEMWSYFWLDGNLVHFAGSATLYRYLVLLPIEQRAAVWELLFYRDPYQGSCLNSYQLQLSHRHRQTLTQPYSLASSVWLAYYRGHCSRDSSSFRQSGNLPPHYTQVGTCLPQYRPLHLTMPVSRLEGACGTLFQPRQFLI